MVAQLQQITQNRRPDWAEDDQLRQQRYTEAREFAGGTQWLGKPKRGEKRLTFNYGRRLPEKVAAYVFPAPVRFSVSADDTAAADRVEKLLAEVLDEIGADELDEALCVEASTLGDAVVKVTWDPVARMPVLGQVDPATVAAWYDPTNPRRIFRVVQRYHLPGAALAPALGLSADQVAAVSADELYPIEEDWTDTTWKLTAAGQVVKSGANPYAWNPYLIIANSPEPRHLWGRPDLVDLYDPLRELNARMSTVSTILELSGAPIAVLENVDGSEGITVRPGAKWEIPEGAKAYLLDLLEGQGVQLHMTFIDLIYRTLHDLAEAPRTSFGDTGRALSGVALEVEVQPLVQQVRRKRRAFSRYFQERNARILDLLERFGGHDVGGMRRTSPIWPEVLPSDRDAQVRQAAQLVASQIQSRRSSAAALGAEDPEGELTRVIEEIRMLAAATPTVDGETERRADGETERRRDGGEDDDAGEGG